MPTNPNLADAEWKVMKLLWRKSPQPAYDLAQVLGKSEGWSPATVKTLLNRLLKKGALKHEQYKNLYLYAPAVNEEACIAEESRSFLHQVFDGSVGNLMVHFAKSRDLSEDEINELRKILDAPRNERKK